MKNTIFKGAGVAIVTPMKPDGSVNYEKLRNLIDYQIENGTQAIIACGTTGESPTLTHEEHVEVIKTAVKHTAGRVPVIAGTGSNDTRYALELSKEAESLGADALLMVTPYYNKTSQTGLIKHYTYVADNVNLPIILYNVPGRTGTDIKPQTYAVLAEHKNIVAIKEANANINAITETMSVCGDKIDLYSGCDEHILPVLAMGGMGVISVLSNIIPKQTNDICKYYFDGKTEKSRALQLKYYSLIKALFSDVNPIPVKEAMNMMGFDIGKCRLPLCDMSEDAKIKLRAELEKNGLI